jgi:hypothetical protein|tara:strand:+ start:3064 stop:3387 length:324 start_codon:yes stop_codon:yes gene_type:complete
MAIDIGSLNVNTAGTPEKFSADLAAQAVIRLNTRVKKILFKAPSGNTGDVYIGMFGRDKSTATVSSSYGFVLAKGESQLLEDVNEVFSNFQGDAATNNDDINWVAWF